ncbi:DUF84 family protein [Patescibacteria group bacterium]|nr:DUF84 family protein [Patescibacteria group bacterium]
MKIHIGSKNKVKVTASHEAINMYPEIFPSPEIISIDIDVDLFGHPKNIEETVTGAITRAKKAHKKCDYSIGLEGGLIEVPHTKTGFMEINACVVFDGKNHHLGLSSAFEWPTEVSQAIISGQFDASQAFKQLNMTDQEKLGAAPGGICGFLTKGRHTREQQIKQSVIMAMIQLENSHLYK